MISIESANLHKWMPNFSSSGLSNPEWTRVVSEGVAIINSLECVDWSKNPVQVILCEDCGTVHCARGGYVHISKMGPYLLWTAPQINLEDEWERAEYEGSYALRRFGAILTPAFVWEKWQSIGHYEARFSCFPPATRRELRDAWLMELKGASQVRRDTELLPMLKRRLLGCDSLSVEAALSKVAYL